MVQCLDWAEKLSTEELREVLDHLRFKLKMRLKEAAHRAALLPRLGDGVEILRDARRLPAGARGHIKKLEAREDRARYWAAWTLAHIAKDLQGDFLEGTVKILLAKIEEKDRYVHVTDEIARALGRMSTNLPPDPFGRTVKACLKNGDPVALRLLWDVAPRVEGKLLGEMIQALLPKLKTKGVRSEAAWALARTAPKLKGKTLDRVRSAVERAYKAETRQPERANIGVAFRALKTRKEELKSGD